ncbi:hypothetical protein Har1130_18965 [Haloarcula sp. CBA1130]|uniref:hypothetical protein n=1 Tax=unclassified Haloarcula TaxID=2624677 RepID=UPI001247B9CE|nr:MULTISPECIES: hypothetical protein [unclassified Haloarcula]KAA9396362.1 hypothetical protein Har1130_18965 [Haloarcula sp. CBA1130]KAA9397466.1 hypothetical protein Har1129_04050 [Haloarcula sp. CBA1129]
MSKKLILCEGKWDLRLLNEYIKHRNLDFELETFSVEDIEGQDKRGKESDMIQSFGNSYYPCEILIKSENGREILKDVYSNEIHGFLEKSFSINLLIDLDHCTIDEWLDEVNKKTNFTNETNTLTECELVATTEMVGYRCRIEVGGRKRGEVIISAFRDKMEEAAGIDKGIHDTKEQKFSIIREYAQCGELDSVLSNTIF